MAAGRRGRFRLEHVERGVYVAEGEIAAGEQSFGGGADRVGLRDHTYPCPSNARTPPRPADGWAALYLVELRVILARYRRRRLEQARFAIGWRRQGIHSAAGPETLKP